MPVSMILGGFILLSSAWTMLFKSQRTGRLATTGAYAYVRYLQYLAFIVIMIGFLVQWPTLIMFPILMHLGAFKKRPR